MELIIVYVQVPALASAALSLLMCSSCKKASMDPDINACGHNTLNTPDLVWSRSDVQAGSEQRAVECLLGPPVLVSDKVFLW